MKINKSFAFIGIQLLQKYHFFNIFVSYIAYFAMKSVKTFILIALACITASCSLVTYDEVVAKVGRHRLHKGEVEQYIPAGISREDSIAFAQKYIKAWAGEMIIGDMAMTQLSKAERDITREMQEYKNALLKFRYEQRYIADRLDTLVSDAQVEKYYNENQKVFTLKMPIAKVCYLRIPQSSPMKDQLKKMLESDSEDDIDALDSLARTFASKYTRYNDKWVDMVTLARDFGTDYGSLIAQIKDSYIDIVDEQGMEHIAYLVTYIPSGKIPPVDYCAEKIRSVIIGQRKHLLEANLEQDLLDDALKKGNFIIYEDEQQQSGAGSAMPWNWFKR